jgi:prepilin-type N-terminal cleavage/methylation domain-containing protein
MATRAHTTGVPRLGFTLAELMTVIAMIAILSTLVIGTLFRSRTTNRLLAAEHAVADAVRQARHSARSTGSPVELRLSPVRSVAGGPVTGGRITGVTRVCLYSNSFDRGHGPTDDGYGFGMSGTGRVVSGKMPWVPNEEAERDATVRPRDGLYLACAVRPPLAAHPKSPLVIPLILWGKGDDVATSAVGVMLVRSDANLGNDPAKGVKRITVQKLQGGSVKMLCWEVVGWVAGKEGIVEISSFDHVPEDIARDQPTLPTGVKDLAGPIGGDRWDEFGLLYDGDQLVLYRNGRRIAQRRDGVPDRLVGADKIIVGQALVDGNVVYANQSPIDDVRLFKLGTEAVGDLPQGVRPLPDPSLPQDLAVEYRVLAHPDGRVELAAAYGADPSLAAGVGLNTAAESPVGGIFLGGDFTRPRGGGPGANSAHLTVASDGRVASRLILSAPAP